MNKPISYWYDWHNAKKELNSLLEEFNKFPTKLELEHAGLGSLYDAIIEYHGGVVKVKQKLGLEKPKPRNYWTSLENSLYEARKFINENGLEYLPGHKEIFRLGYSSLGAAIQNYHGGYHEFRKKINVPWSRKNTL